MKGKFVVAFAVLSALCAPSVLGAQISEGDYNVNDYCNLVQSGTFLASTESCSNYYSCQTNGPVLQTCASGLWFDKATQSCVEPADSDCVGNPCSAEANGAFVAYSLDCVVWASCQNKAVAYTGYCQSGQIFDGGKCTYATCTPPTLALPCAVVPPNVYFGSESDCAEYQICSTTGAVTNGTCTGSQGFDVATGSCVNSATCNQTTSTTESSAGGGGGSGDAAGVTTPATSADSNSSSNSTTG